MNDAENSNDVPGKEKSGIFLLAMDVFSALPL